MMTPAQLATFVHEQIHWFSTDQVGHARTNAAVSELRGLYPQGPDCAPLKEPETSGARISI